MKNPTPYQTRSGEVITIRSASEIATNVRTVDAGLAIRIPRHWMTEPALNIHAVSIEVALFDWFRTLGFGEQTIEKLRTFEPAHYAGIPFPRAGRDELFCIARYLSLWLLWDDEDVEAQGRGFRLRSQHVLGPHSHAPINLFDRAWWSLFRELAEVHSPEWIEKLLESMQVWSMAALEEARVAKARRDGYMRVTFSEALQSRIATIGMYATGQLIEHVRHVELPREFYEHATVHKIKMLASKIVGLGNDLLSLGKDMTSNYVNVVLVLQDELTISLRDALRAVVQMHEEALAEFDRSAISLPSFGAQYDEAIDDWLRDLRKASVGFTVWEARAPRYAAFKVVVDGAVVDPYLVFHTPVSGYASACAMMR